MRKHYKARSLSGRVCVLTQHGIAWIDLGPISDHLQKRSRLDRSQIDLKKVRTFTFSWPLGVNGALVTHGAPLARARAPLLTHPQRPRSGQSGREKRRDKSFQAKAEKPLGTDSHRTISKRSRECWLLIERKKCFVLLCPIGEQHLLSSFREFVHDGY